MAAGEEAGPIEQQIIAQAPEGATGYKLEVPEPETSRRKGTRPTIELIPEGTPWSLDPFQDPVRVLPGTYRIRWYEGGEEVRPLRGPLPGVRLELAVPQVVPQVQSPAAARRLELDLSDREQESLRLAGRTNGRLATIQADRASRDLTLDTLAQAKAAVDPFLQGTADLIGTLPTLAALVKQAAEAAAAPPPPQPSATATAVSETLRGIFSLGTRVIDRLPVEDLGSAIKARLLGAAKTPSAPEPAPAPGLGSSAAPPEATPPVARATAPMHKPTRQEEVIVKLRRLWEKRPDLVDQAEGAIDDELLAAEAQEAQGDGQGDDQEDGT